MKRNSIKLISLLVFFFCLVSVNFILASRLWTHLIASAQYNQLLDKIGDLPPDNHKQFTLSQSPSSVDSVQTDIKLGDARAANLRSFFAKYKSDLYDHADLIVEQADRYSFDYRLLAAIAFQESGLCAKAPENSFNCWGWGIYGNTVTRFASYEEGIKKVSRGIKINYLDKGLVTASEVMAKYAPHSKGSWSQGVNHFMNLIEK